MAGATPATPPSPQTARLLSPRPRDTSACKSGRAVGSFGFELNSCWPIAKLDGPGTTSITIRKPKPLTAWYNGTGTSVTGVAGMPSADATPKKVMTGPWLPSSP